MHRCRKENKKEMPMREDPNMPRRPMPPNDARSREDGGYAGWVFGGLAALAIAAMLMFAFSNDPSTTATNTTNRPAATQPASPPANPPYTTGSGATTPAPAAR
jgi:hypothetical protein